MFKHKRAKELNIYVDLVHKLIKVNKKFKFEFLRSKTKKIFQTKQKPVLNKISLFVTATVLAINPKTRCVLCSLLFPAKVLLLISKSAFYGF